MVNLTIKELNQDLSIVKRLKKSLVKKFKLDSAVDIDKAVVLANFLFSIGKKDESKELLDSFIYLVKYDSENLGVWGSNGQGIILRAYMSMSDGESYSNLINIINEKDIMTDRASRYDLYLECIHEHEMNMDRAKTESHKYRSEIIGQEALTFLYFFMMMPGCDDDVASNLKKILNNCYSDLKSILLNPKQEKMSYEEYEEKYKNFRPL